MNIILLTLLTFFVLVFGARIFVYVAELFWDISGKIVVWGLGFAVFLFLVKVGAL